MEENSLLNRLELKYGFTMDRKQVGEALGVSYATVKRMENTGELKPMTTIKKPITYGTEYICKLIEGE